MQGVWVSMLLLMVIVTIFALQNAAAVQIHLLFWKFRASLALIIIGSAFVGALFTFVLSFFHQRRLPEKTQGTGQTVADPIQAAPEAAPVKDGSETIDAKDMAN